MRQEQITFDGVEGVVDSAAKAQMAGDNYTEISDSSIHNPSLLIPKD